MAQDIDTIEELIAILDRDCPDWRDDWDNNPIDAGLGECVIEHVDAHYLTDYKPLDFRDGAANEERLRAHQEEMEEFYSLGDCDEEFPEGDLPPGFQDVDYDLDTGEDLWYDDNQ